MSIFDVRIPGLKLTVVAADGQDVEPVSVDEFRIAAAETYDVIVEPKEDRAYTIFAQAIDRSGYARGTLAPREGMTAEVPLLDPRPLLMMSDMGMSHGAHDHAAMGHAPPIQHAPAENGATVDMKVDQVSTSLNDPGIGLRDNGRRVLSYGGIGSGFSDLELGLRLRYEFRREFAPYVGLHWERKFGRTADLARDAGDDPDELQLVAGFRLWF